MTAMLAGRILVVDDDAAIRTVVREAMRRAGHVVETVATLAEMRRALIDFAPTCWSPTSCCPTATVSISCRSCCGGIPDCP